jgi:hypothetical protein
LASIRKAGTTATIPSGAMTPAQALAALQSILSPDAETPAEGYLTMEQWADAWSLSLTHTSRMIRQGMAKGVVEKAEYRLEAGKRKVPHYRVKA